MGTPAEELEAKLAQFERLHPAEGAKLRAMVSGSAELGALLQASIQKGNLDGGFQPLSATKRMGGTLGTFNAGTEVMSLPMDLLLSSDPKDANTLLSTIAHETAHAIHKADIQKTFDQLNADLASVASGPPPRNYTATLKGFLDDSRSREASDEIGGVNVLAAKIRRENPSATQEQLYEALYKSTDDVRNYFNVAGSGEDRTYTPKHGISFNDQFQIEPNAANVAAFGKHFFDARGYPAMYGQSVIDYAGSLEAKAQIADLADPTRVPAPATVNLSTLGIRPADVTLPSGMALGTAPRMEAMQAPLPPTSDRLVQDSERFVRQIADQHQLPWDAGMRNTVYAVASSAKEAGLSEITHFKAADGHLRIAQYDGYTVRETTLGAKTAANTPSEQSREQLGKTEPALATLQSPSGPVRAPEPEVHAR